MSDKNNTVTVSAKLSQLSELVTWFEGDEFELELALKKFAEAEKLSKEIEKELGEFKNRISVLKKDFSQ